ncbi:hypothetical protein [Streptomyces cavernicola]|uniref:GNAT family N-acetyltransferase n=1 Tax=Streptomyces cavernicola TaxID=3043613 RepID=A0ABT6SDH8_9ACTN|nr:hypothetical protein [Streptomyces sp. B-S-A6]MDI3405874.1 hypothetical protein [Streptomyces sp. B-S-A6]
MTRSVITELSPAALAEVVRLERSRNYLWPGGAETCLLLWARFVRAADHRLWVDNHGGCGIWECCGDPYLAREFLEGLMLAMSRRRGRELRRVVASIDVDY